MREVSVRSIAIPMFPGQVIPQGSPTPTPPAVSAGAEFPRSM